MAGRQNKVGLDYFELDCHMDEKVRLIQAEYGLKGFAVVVKLYQEIYGGNGYYCEWTQDRELLFASENGLNGGSFIKDIVAACIKRNIFSERLFKEYGILSSSGVQKQYLKATVKREVVDLKKEYLLISIPENRENVVLNSISDGINLISVGRNTQSRVKKSIGENNNIFVPPTVLEVADYCVERKNNVDAEAFVNFYTANGWVQGKGKPIKDWKAAVRTWEKNSKGKPPPKNKFNQFQQNSYDFDSLEKELLSN